MGDGILAIWNNRRPDAAERYEFWYQTEHLPERLAVPGFLRGRRYQAINGSPEFFTWYEVEQPGVLFSEAYFARLSDPTPLTREIMSGIFADASRTVCDRTILQGDMFGSVVVTVRLDDVVTRAMAGPLISELTEPVTLARAELWTSAETGRRAGAQAEEELRGPDQKIACCLMAEFLHDSTACAVADRLRERFPGARIGVYRLLCERR